MERLRRLQRVASSGSASGAAGNASFGDQSAGGGIRDKRTAFSGASFTKTVSGLAGVPAVSPWDFHVAGPARGQTTIPFPLNSLR